MKTKKPKYRSQGISFPDEALFESAMAKAESQNRSLSNYICTLIAADLKKGEDESRARYPVKPQFFILDEKGDRPVVEPPSESAAKEVKESKPLTDAQKIAKQAGDRHSSQHQHKK